MEHFLLAHFSFNNGAFTSHSLNYVSYMFPNTSFLWLSLLKDLKGRKQVLCDKEKDILGQESECIVGPGR